jgi:hypothetical protein
MPATDTVELLSDWPQPGTGNAGPIVHYGHGPLRLAYETPDERVAVVTVPLCLQLVCGHPNDEALQGHALYDKGLRFYSVHRVGNSSRLAAMERANAMHPSHDPASYLKSKEHWVFTFQDCTVEFVALVLEGNRPSFTVGHSWQEANALLARSDA